MKPKITWYIRSDWKCQWNEIFWRNASQKTWLGLISWKMTWTMESACRKILDLKPEVNTQHLNDELKLQVRMKKRKRLAIIYYWRMKIFQALVVQRKIETIIKEEDEEDIKVQLAARKWSLLEKTTTVHKTAFIVHNLFWTWIKARKVKIIQVITYLTFNKEYPLLYTLQLRRRIQRMRKISIYQEYNSIPPMLTNQLLLYLDF